MITIRHAYLEEYEMAAAITIKACQSIQTTLKTEDWEEMRTSLSSTTQLRNGGELLIAIEEGMIVGAAVYHAPDSPKNTQIPKEWGMIDLLAVIPTARGCGIGSRLIKTCIDLARSDKVGTLGFYIDHFTIEAVHLCAKFDFKQTNQTQRLYNVDQHLYTLTI